MIEISPSQMWLRIYSSINIHRENGFPILREAIKANSGALRKLESFITKLPNQSTLELCREATLQDVYCVARSRNEDPCETMYERIGSTMAVQYTKETQDEAVAITVPLLLKVIEDEERREEMLGIKRVVKPSRMNTELA